MNTDIYYQYNPWWENDWTEPAMIERPMIFSLIKNQINTRNIVILTGLRRIGKTTLLKATVKYLLDQGIDNKLIFYVSCDDFSLNSLSIIDIVRDYRKLHKLTNDTQVYLFLDEISYKDRFEQQIKNLYDSQSVKIFASSSSASVLRDKKAFLTGREIIIEIPPLNFEEYKLFNSIKIKKRDSYLEREYFNDYLEHGGIPEYVLYRDRSYLQHLVDDIIYKDIIAFHSIKNHNIIREFFLLLMERSGKRYSVNKIAKILSISPDTASRYLRLFEDTYLIHIIARYGKTNEVILAPKKVYAADIGIRSHYTGFRDTGSLFENYIFLLIRHNRVNYLYENKIELDFVVNGNTLIEVKLDREMKGRQLELFKNYKIGNRIFIQSFHDICKIEDLLYSSME